MRMGGARATGAGAASDLLVAPESSAGYVGGRRGAHNSRLATLPCASDDAEVVEAAMIRWTETRDSYRASLLPGGELLQMWFAILLLMGGAIACESSAHPLAVPLAVGALLLCFRMAAVCRRAPWIDTPLKGGVVTWGRGESTEGWTSTPVRRFELEELPGAAAGYRVVAILDDGRSRQSIITMRSSSPVALAPLVSRLNDHVGAARGLSRSERDLVPLHYASLMGRAVFAAITIIVGLALLVCGWMVVLVYLALD